MSIPYCFMFDYIGCNRRKLILKEAIFCAGLVGIIGVFICCHFGRVVVLKGGGQCHIMCVFWFLVQRLGWGYRPILFVVWFRVGRGVGWLSFQFMLVVLMLEGALF